MIELFEEKSYLTADKDRIAKLMMSFNEPMVAPSHHHAQPTHAYVCTYKEDAGFYVYIYLYLTMEKTGVIYRSDDKFQTPEECADAEDEAIQFTEGMGFLIDDLRFNDLETSQQEKLLTTLPLFSPKKIEVPTEVIPEAKAEEVAIKAVEQIEVKEKLEEKPVKEEVKEEAKEEKEWEPEVFLSKFRMRAAAERIKKDTKQG